MESSRCLGGRVHVGHRLFGIAVRSLLEKVVRARRWPCFRWLVIFVHGVHQRVKNVLALIGLVHVLVMVSCETRRMRSLLVYRLIATHDCLRWLRGRHVVDQRFWLVLGIFLFAFLRTSHDGDGLHFALSCALIDQAAALFRPMPAPFGRGPVR